MFVNIGCLSLMGLLQACPVSSCNPQPAKDSFAYGAVLLSYACFIFASLPQLHFFVVCGIVCSAALLIQRCDPNCIVRVAPAVLSQPTLP